MRIFGIAGFKNSGKTTLVCDLVAEISRRGFRVATVKHAHHAFDIDHQGKDSYMHRQAGAREVLVVSSRRWAHITELCDDEPEPPLDALLGHLGDVDLVLVEGYKHGDHPKLEVRRAVLDHPELAGYEPGIRAIVSDGSIEDAPVPVLERADVSGIATFILTEVGIDAT